MGVQERILTLINSVLDIS